MSPRTEAIRSLSAGLRSLGGVPRVGLGDMTGTEPLRRRVLDVNLQAGLPSRLPELQADPWEGTRTYAGVPFDEMSNYYERYSDFTGNDPSSWLEQARRDILNEGIRYGDFPSVTDEMLDAARMEGRGIDPHDLSWEDLDWFSSRVNDAVDSDLFERYITLEDRILNTPGIRDRYIERMAFDPQVVRDKIASGGRVSGDEFDYVPEDLYFIASNILEVPGLRDLNARAVEEAMSALPRVTPYPDPDVIDALGYLPTSRRQSAMEALRRMDLTNDTALGFEAIQELGGNRYGLDDADLAQLGKLVNSRPDVPVEDHVNRILQLRRMSQSRRPRPA